jgi:hypothetical protein
MPRSGITVTIVITANFKERNVSDRPAQAGLFFYGAFASAGAIRLNSPCGWG